MNPLKLPEGSVRAILALAIVLTVCVLACVSFSTGEPPAGATSGALLTAFGTIIEKYFAARKSEADALSQRREVAKENP